MLPVSLAGDYSHYPTHITVTSKYVSSYAVCSCGASSGSYTTRHNGTFLNYCPNCHRYGGLGYTKYCAEGQITCRYCDSDYCAADGKEKMSNSGVYLTRYTIPKPVVANNTTIPVDPTIEVSGIKMKQSTYSLIQNKLGFSVF